MRTLKEIYARQEDAQKAQAILADSGIALADRYEIHFSNETGFHLEMGASGWCVGEPDADIEAVVAEAKVIAQKNADRYYPE